MSCVHCTHSPLFYPYVSLISKTSVGALDTIHLIKQFWRACCCPHVIKIYTTAYLYDQVPKGECTVSEKKNCCKPFGLTVKMDEAL